MYCAMGRVPVFFRVSLFLQIATFLCGTSLLGIGYLLGGYNIILWGILLLFICNLIYGISEWKKRLIFLFFHAMIFTFLVSRPLISMCRDYQWWYFGREQTYFALNLIWITLLCLRIGCAVYERFAPSDKKSCISETATGYAVYKETDMMRNLRLIALIFYLLTSVFFWMVQIERLQFIQQHDYADIYLSYTEQLPGFVYSIADMSNYGICIYLATFPKKKWTYGPLILFVLGAVPDLVIGIRNTIVLNLLFAFLYFLLRDILERRSHWFGRFEKIAVVVFLPTALIFLSFYNYARDGQIVSMGIWDSIEDLFYKQGVTFDVLCRTHDALPNLPDVVEKNYTFGSFIDYATRGTIARSLLGTSDLGSQNSEILAIYGNSFSHSMSYVAHPEYLSGHGWGSSYLLELFADWGYMGVALGSTVLGAILRWMVDAMKRGVFLRIVILRCMIDLFFIPRAAATGWIVFLITFQFWVAVSFCFFIASLLNKKYSFPTRRKKEHDYV